MFVANHLTARDYFDRVLFGNIAHRQGYTAGRFKPSESGRFHQLLTSLGNRQSDSNNLKPSGWTVIDYLRHPVRTNGLCDNKIMSAASKNKEAPAVSAPSTPTHSDSHDPTIKTLVNPRVKTTSQMVEDRSDYPAPAQTDPTEKRLIEKSIHKAAIKYNLPVNLLTGLVMAESNFQVTAISRSGAQGLTQLMPATAKELGVVDPFDIEQNIDGGARYLRKMLDSYGGDVKLALAAYNAGPGTVAKYGGEIPPYPETKWYVDRVLKFANRVV